MVSHTRKMKGIPRFLALFILASFVLLALNSCREHKVRVAPKTKVTPTQTMKSGITDKNFTLSDPDDPESLLIEKELEKEGVPVIAVIGTGKFFKLSTIGDVKGPGDPEDKVYLNFDEADIPSVMRMVVDEILDLDLDLDPDVQGVMTFKMKRPVPRHKLLGELQNALADNNINLLDINKKVYVMSEAKRYSEDAPRHHGTQKIGDKSVLPIKLNYVSATQMQKVIQPILAGGARIQVDSARNIIIASGESQDILTVHEMIRMFDVDWLAGMSFAIFPLDAADAGTIIYELENIFDQQNAALDDVFRFVPLERLNSIMVITKQPEYFERIAQWIKRLDYGEKQSGYGLHVYYLTNSKADAIADMLQDLFMDGLPAIQDTKASPDDGELDKHSSDDKRDKLISEKSNKNFAAPTVGGVRIIADIENNALIIKSTSSDYRMIEAAIKRLDLPPIQVMIEATIAQVALNDNLKYGLSAFFDKGNFGVSFNGGQAAANAVATIDKGLKFVFRNMHIAGTLDLVKEVTDVKVLSSPYALVHNNKQAEIRVGRQVPVLTQQSTSTASAGAPTLQQIEFKEIGLELAVTPRVNNDGKVTLEIRQETTEQEVAPGGNTAQASLTPSFGEQRLNTIVTVQSGDTVALGGLIRDEKTKGRSGIPILMDIPLLGQLFSSNNIINDRSELLILLSPKIIKNDEDSLIVTEEFKERLNLIQKVKFEGHKLFPEHMTKAQYERTRREMDQISERFLDNEKNSPKMQQEVHYGEQTSLLVAPQEEDAQSLSISVNHQNESTAQVLDRDQAAQSNPAQNSALNRPQSLLESAGHAPPQPDPKRPAMPAQSASTAMGSASLPAHKVQVKIYEDRDLAEEEWIRLSRKFAQDLDFSTIQVFYDNMGKNGFRLESDEMDEKSANNFCNVLRERGEECSVIGAK